MSLRKDLFKGKNIFYGKVEDGGDNSLNKIASMQENEEVLEELEELEDEEENSFEGLPTTYVNCLN